MQFGNRVIRISQLIADSITGALIQTAATGVRWVLSSPSNADELAGYTGDPAEVIPGLLQVAAVNYLGNASLNVALRSPSYTSEGAFLALYSLLATLENHADLVAQQISLRSNINPAAALAALILDGDAGTVDVTGIVTLEDNLVANGDAAVVGDANIGGGLTVGLGGVGINGGLIVALNAAIHGAVGLTVDHALTVGDSLTLNGKKISAIDFGTWSGTTDASGQITGIPHSLGIKPVYTNLNQSGGSGSGRPRVLSTTTTTFTIQVNNTTTGAAFAAGSAFSGQYFSIA
jgi:hypothetical protein